MSRIQIRTIALAGMLAFISMFAGTAPAWSAETIQGVPNWSRVTNSLYRGAQPDSAGFKALQQMGVTIIVNFRDESAEIAAERREVESLGIKYVSIPWSGSDEPSNAQVVQFLNLVRENPNAKIFVHCKRGADRTGVMIAAYRIAVEHENVAEAVSEMHQFHYAHFWLPQLERYVKTLPQLLTGNPVFSAYALAPSVASAPNTVAATAPIAAWGTAPVASPAMAK